MDGARAPGFTSESVVLTAFARILGVKHLDVSAPFNCTHHSVVVRHNKFVDKPEILDVAQPKGDVDLNKMRMKSRDE